MKLFLTAVLLSFSTLGMANDAFSNISETTQIESVYGDKGKKSRRNKRANRKRKKRCARAARHNYAG